MISSYVETTFRFLEATKVCIVCYNSINPGHIYCNEHTVKLTYYTLHHGCGEGGDLCRCYFNPGEEEIHYKEDDVYEYQKALQAVLIISSYFKKYKRRKKSSV